jgi:GDP-L-fucose synthase
MLKKKDKILIAGQEGMVGSYIYKLLKKKNYKIIECKRSQLDFTNYKSTLNFFKKTKPTIVINAAGKVGGILDNSKFPIEYLNSNIKIGMNIINISYLSNVRTLINLGSACIYPKITKLPIKEKFLLSGYLESTNEGYALAKIVTLKLCEYYKIIKKKNFISLQPANLYGKNDNFDLNSSHVIPALIRKFYEAKKKNKNYVKIWGSGKNKREFMHVEDLADGIFFLLKRKGYFLDSFYNIGSNEEVSIMNVAKIIKKISNFKGRIIADKNKPKGQLRRVLDSGRINSLGWQRKISLKRGLREVYKYYEQINK